LIGGDDYRRHLRDAILFLEGKSGEVISALVQRMEAAAAALNFEDAALCRDQIVELRQVQQRQHVEGESGDLDVVACAVQGGAACVQVFVFRGGRLLGNKAFFPRLPEGEDAPAVQNAFLAQYYFDKDVPTEILVGHEPADAALLAGALSELLAGALSEQAGRRIAITCRVRGERARWLEMATRNAEHALAAQLSSQTGMRHRLEALRDALGFECELGIRMRAVAAGVFRREPYSGRGDRRGLRGVRRGGRDQIGLPPL